MRLSPWFVSLALVACSPPVQWQKPGASERVMESDMHECRLKTSLSPQSRATPELSQSVAKTVGSVQEDRAREDAALFRKCMEEKGYSAK